MGITIEGDYPEVQRTLTGIYSLDYALSSQNTLGMPIRTIYEIYGRPGAGKSSLAYYMAGRVNPTGRIELCDLEGLDRDYVVSSLAQGGFEGILRFIQNTDTKQKPRTHEAMLQETVANLREDRSSCAILDSIGAIVPIAEDSGDIGDANMGRRAKAVAQYVRGLTMVMQYMEVPKVAFVINHVNAVIGGRGHTTPGGDTLKHLAKVRIMISVSDIIEDSNKNAIAFISKGVIEKLRFGAAKKKFTFVIIPGVGVSPDLSAMWDCFELGLAERKATVKVGKTSVGYISKLVDDASKGRHDKFLPFYDAIDDYKRKTFGLVIPDMGGIDEQGNIEVAGLEEDVADSSEED
jgi:RecA/RadA recombinase